MNISMPNAGGARSVAARPSSGIWTWMRQQSFTLSISAAVLLVLLGLWWLVDEANWVEPSLLPSPATAWDSFTEFAFGDGYRGQTLFAALGASLARVAAGFFLAACVAVPLGILAGWRREVGDFLEPVVNFYRPIPPLGYYALLVVWFGIGEGSKVALLFLTAFPPIVLATTYSVRAVDQQYHRAAATLGANSRQMLSSVTLRAAAPGIVDGLRVSILNTYAALVAAELISASVGVGA